ncbi:MAG: PucR family transcriptional regulator [Floccifex sp.]
MISLNDIMIQVGDQYKMTCIAGKNGCSNIIGWVHIVEDPTIIQFLWSNDLALTCGLGFQDEKSLMDCVMQLIKRNCVGLIINTGKYINEIPASIIDYCDAKNFPLITIPWEIRINIFIKDISIRCQKALMDDQKIAQYFMKGFRDETKLEQYRDELMLYFDTQLDFQVTLISMDNLPQTDIDKQRATARIRYFFGDIHCKYLFFWYEECLVLITNAFSENQLISLCEKMIHTAKRKLDGLQIYIGIGSKLNDLHSIPRSYKRAKASLKYARTFKKELACFKDTGMYQILFSIEDQDILDQYYQDCLNPLIEYDEKHNSQLLLTFKYFLKYNGSIQLIAQELYTHRNTINYRIQKIKSLLNSELDRSDELFKYALAFYINEN